MDVQLGPPEPNWNKKLFWFCFSSGWPSKLFSHKSQNRSGYILIRVKPAPNNQPDRVAIKEKIHLNLIIPSHTHTHTHKTSQFQPLPNPSLLLLPLPNPSPSSVDLILTVHTQLTYTTILRRTMTTNTTTTKMAPASPEGCEQPVDGV